VLGCELATADNIPVRATSTTTLRLVCAALIASALLPSCRTVEFYEKAALADAAMQSTAGRCEVHWQQKVFYSHEGSAGGIGTVAGGGCGCY
jgi:hypothetical protein